MASTDHFFDSCESQERPECESSEIVDYSIFRVR
jgi:hypothetical protein